MKTVLILLRDIEERHKAKLEAAAPGCRLVYAGHDTVTPEEMQGADIIIGNPDPRMLSQYGKPEFLQIETAGADAYTAPGVLEAGTVLACAVGAYNVAVAEHAFALTLMLQKKLHLYRDEQHKALWRDRGPVSTLSSGTVLVVGLGNIGRHYAGLVKAMGARVIGVKRTVETCPPCADEVVTVAELDRVLPEADVIMSVLPDTAETRRLYTPERFGRMKDSAIFINCGRGSAVSSETLYQALKERKIAAAGIDVADPEPLPKDSPLWELENLVITPHISGGHHLPVTVERIVDIAAENLTAFLKGGPLRNVVEHTGA